MGFLKKVTKTAVDVGAPGASLLYKATHPGSVTQDQVPLETPEQAAMRKKLADFSNTGVFGNYVAGADIGIKPGNYTMTGTEKAGQTALQQLIASGLPAGYGEGDAALKDLLNPDPNFIASQFDPFKTQIERQINQSSNDMKRSAAYTGSLYSTGAIKGLGDVQARGNETLTAQLASLTNDALNRRLSAIPLAYSSGAAEEALKTSRIATSQQYGGLERDLANASINDANAETLRKRNELLQPISAAQSVAGTNANFGVPSVTVQNPNPYLDLLTSLIQAGGKVAGAKG